MYTHIDTCIYVYNRYTCMSRHAICTGICTCEQASTTNAYVCIYMYKYTYTYMYEDMSGQSCKMFW